MIVSVIPGRELTPDHVSRWFELQKGNLQLASPCFCPEFTQAVSAVRNDVFIGLMKQAGEIIGFFPFQRGRMRTGRPVGGALCDYQGVIAANQAVWSPGDLLAGCGLICWNFDHLIVEQAQFRPHHEALAEAYFVDISAGFEAYAERMREEGSSLMRKHAQAIRRIERDLGPLRFEPDVNDADVLEKLLQWKSAQYRRTGLVDVFSFAWARRLLAQILRTRAQRFSGILSALYADNRLVAAHMGMRSSTVWHWWFPSYALEHQQYSPGMILLVEALRYAEKLPARILDLAKGDAFYKDRLRGESRLVATGRVERPSVATWLKRLYRGTEVSIRHSPLLPLARVPGRRIKSKERRRRFQ